ncbi:hypothetical protein sphantq_02492 [Sphingobium sp. AntQ-1]|uniref:hypothetical protein n=1 Tax=Sphingobium sp. AntQ-1 TaxID=2930091 RepID=UPI00234F94DF|nr:hypothetical protein [Sphingobium sp. AntQ-1]WCP14050.1 hypothetical protein sphantq_02492 [Sphingobium sp. AntQ-1]
MDELDMSGVDPLRYDEVRRRVAVVKDYLALPLPTEADQKAHAVRLDLSINQFMALVRVWRDYRSAAKMAASGAHRGEARRPNRLTLDPKAKDATAGVIDELGPNASLTQIMRLVVERCEALGVRAPSRGTVWNMAMAARQGHDSGEAGIVVGTCGVRLPISTPDGISVPSLTIAVRASDGAILAAALQPADWQTAAMTIASAAIADAQVRAASDLLALNRNDAIRAGVTPIPAVKARSAISRILGRSIDSIALIYQPSKALAPERLLTAKQDRPLSPADARMLITAAIARHNAARNARDAAWIDAATALKGA